jgi:hypothetical protein
MGFWDSRTAGSFKTLADGKIGFYPIELFGHGFVIPDQRRERIIRRCATYNSLVGGVIGAFSVLFLRHYPRTVGAVLLAYLIISYTGLWILVRDLSRARERLTLAERYTSRAMATSWAILVLLVLIGGIAVSAGYLALIFGSQHRILSLVIVTLFGLVGFLAIYMMEVKREAERDRDWSSSE